MRWKLLTLVALSVALGVGCASSPPVAIEDAAELSSLDHSIVPAVVDVVSPPVTPPKPATVTLPLGARQLAEEYWIGAMIGPNDIPSLKRMGIRVVISAALPDPKTIYLLASANIAHVPVPMGATLRYAERISEVLDQYRPSEVYLHCFHGADRTGVITAYILVTRHKWRVADALYAVVNPGEEDIAGLQRVMSEFCIHDVRTVDDPTVGIYSLARAGMAGGMKVRNRRYRRLVRSALEQMITPATNGLCR